METSKINQSPLFSLAPVVSQSTPPLIVVGLPRSGTSFLTSILCLLDDYYIFDDLYPYQIAQEFNILQKDLTNKEIDQFLNKLSWQLKAKIKWENNFFKPNCTWEDVDQLQQSVMKTFEGKSIKWHQILEEWLTRLALHHNKKYWGYKTPQDFMHMEQLTQLFPKVKFIFIVRDPRKVMASYKNLPNNQGGDGDSRQYHPLAYPIYWKMAYKKVDEFIKKDSAPVYTIKFENLTSDPQKYAQEIAFFLNTSLISQIESKGKNTSFQDDKKRELTDSEIWICQLLTLEIMNKLGYTADDKAKFRVKDIPELLHISYIFLVYQLQRILFSRKKERSSVINFIKHFMKSIF